MAGLNWKKINYVRVIGSLFRNILASPLIILLRIAEKLFPLIHINIEHHWLKNLVQLKLLQVMIEKK